MPEIDTNDVPFAEHVSKPVITSAIHGAAALVVRQALIFGSNMLGGIVLARILPPRQFGLYGIVLFLMAFLNIFGGTGFAANFIRSVETPKLEDLRAVFTLQQMIVAFFFIGLWIVSPWLGHAYHIGQSGDSFFRFIGAALVFTSLMVIPQVLLERELAFNKLASVEVSQAIVFNLACVFFAIKGMGGLTFAVALALRAAFGAIALQIIEPWKIGFRWDPSVLKNHVYFGIALQGGQLMSMLKDSIVPVFVGLFLGTAQVGYVTWAGTLAAYAVLILSPLQRLYLPFFARLQNDVDSLRRYYSYALWISNVIGAPLTMITVALAYPITVIVFTPKWLPALPLFYFFVTANLFVPSAGPMVGLLNAVGKSRSTFYMSLIWMVATWVLGVPLILLFGLPGFGYAMIGVQLCAFILYWMAWKEIKISPWPGYWPSWPSAAAVAILLLLLQMRYTLCSIFGLATYAGLGFVLYLLFLWRLAPHKLGKTLCAFRGAS